MRLPLSNEALAHSPTLQKNQWRAAVRDVLDTWLATWSSAATTRRFAVFDWDNTCIYNDIGDAVWRYQLEHLHFKLTADEARAHLPASVHKLTHLNCGTSVSDLAHDIAESYATLWDAMRQGQGKQALGTPAHQDLRAKLAYLSSGIEKTEGMGPLFGYPWQAQWLKGLSDKEINTITAAAWAHGSQEKPGPRTWTAATAGRAGKVSHTYQGHLAAFDEMRDLMLCLKQCGIDVYVVTATTEPVVAHLVNVIDFPVDSDHVFGLRPFEDPAKYPVTYRAGKVRVIQEHLGGEPVLVAGDANTDYDMLTAFETTCLRLVINRNLPGDMQELYSDDTSTKNGVQILLQGRDDNRACFVDDARFTPQGSNAPVALPLR